MVLNIDYLDFNARADIFFVVGRRPRVPQIEEAMPVGKRDLLPDIKSRRGGLYVRRETSNIIDKPPAYANRISMYGQGPFPVRFTHSSHDRILTAL